MELQARLEEIFSSGYPELREWFLVRQTWLPFMLCGSYALFSTVLGPALMRNRKPLHLRRTMILYNLTVVAIYVVVMVGSVTYLPKLPWNTFCRGPGVLRSGNPEYKLVELAWLAYVIKYLEFFDTVFFVLRKKQNLITFLHVSHHTIVPILGWIMLRTEKSGMQSIPALMNTFVHIIMYSYYGLAAMGPQVRKFLWWKKYLTQLQMAQFILIVTFVLLVAPLSGCSMVKFSYIMDAVVAPFFLYLFYRFYKATFKQDTQPHCNGHPTKCR